MDFPVTEKLKNVNEEGSRTMEVNSVAQIWIEQEA